MTINHILITTDNLLLFDGTSYPCVIGKEGRISAKKKQEGDMKTPVGTYPLRACLYRPDRCEAPETILPVHKINPAMGWCDAPEHLDYNRLVVLPFYDSHELLWREDHCYDLVVVIGYNDDPVHPHKGSAIFMHLPHDDGRATAGCIALTKAHLLEILKKVTPETMIEIASDT